MFVIFFPVDFKPVFFCLEFNLLTLWFYLLNVSFLISIPYWITHKRVFDFWNIRCLCHCHVLLLLPHQIYWFIFYPQCVFCPLRVTLHWQLMEWCLGIGSFSFFKGTSFRVNLFPFSTIEWDACTIWVWFPCRISFCLCAWITNKVCWMTFSFIAI